MKIICIEVSWGWQIEKVYWKLYVYNSQQIIGRIFQDTKLPNPQVASHTNWRQNLWKWRLASNNASYIIANSPWSVSKKSGSFDPQEFKCSLICYCLGRKMWCYPYFTDETENDFMLISNNSTILFCTCRFFLQVIISF